MNIPLKNLESTHTDKQTHTHNICPDDQVKAKLELVYALLQGYNISVSYFIEAG